MITTGILKIDSKILIIIIYSLTHCNFDSKQFFALVQIKITESLLKNPIKLPLLKQSNNLSHFFVLINSYMTTVEVEIPRVMFYKNAWLH